MFNEERSGDELFECECLIDPEHLQVGHYVSRLDRPWRETPFPLEGVMVQSENQRDWFIEHCQWVVIDLLRGRNSHRPTSARACRPGSVGEPPLPHKAKQSADGPVEVLRRARLNAESISSATHCRDLLYRQAGNLIDSLRRTGRVDAEKARLDLRQVAGELESNIAAMVWLSRIRQADEHTAEHCVNVAILCMSVAHTLAWDDDKIEQVGLAGLLHDIGKMQLDPEIINKPGRLTDAEMEYVRKHAAIGYELLRTDPAVPSMVARTVHEHHEQPNGLGYPAGKKANQILPMSGLIAVVSAYDAMTAHSPFRQPLSHHDALGELWRARDRQFDAGMVEQLIRFLGWVTPGTLVLLSDGGHAVVLESNSEHRLWPIVRLLKEADGQFIAAERVDLAGQPELVGAALRIQEILPDGAIPVDLKAILHNEALEQQAAVG